MKNDLYIHGEPKPRKRYFVMDEKIDGDSFGQSFYTKDEAIAEADSQWYHLTAREKRDRRIFVGHIDEAFIPDDVLGEISILGDIDPDDWDAEADETWFSNFSCYDVVYECGMDEAIAE